MPRFNFPAYFFLLCLLSGGLISCEDEGCGFSTRTAMRIDFYTQIIDTAIRDTVTAIDLEGIYGIGREDSVMYEGQNLQSVTLPLPLDRNECQFVLEYPDGRDTISLAYRRQVNYISQGCGFVTFFELLEVNNTGHRIENMVLRNPSIETGANEENIRLYY